MSPQFNEDCADRAIALQSILAAYTKATGRQCNYMVHEYGLWAYKQAGFGESDMALVCSFLIRENSRNNYKYSLHLTKLIGDLARFDDLLCEAKAVSRNRKPPPTPREQVQSLLRPVVGEATQTGSAMSVQDILRKVVQ